MRSTALALAALLLCPMGSLAHGPAPADAPGCSYPACGAFLTGPASAFTPEEWRTAFPDPSSLPTAWQAPSFATPTPGNLGTAAGWLDVLVRGVLPLVLHEQGHDALGAALRRLPPPEGKSAPEEWTEGLAQANEVLRGADARRFLLHTMELVAVLPKASRRVRQRAPFLEGWGLAIRYALAAGVSPDRLTHALPNLPTSPQ